MYGEEAGSTEVNLYGRDRERQELDRLLEEARRGNGSALVLWGDPGIGKTALLEYAAAQTTGFTVLGCRGSRMESRLAFAALHGLLWPLVDRIGTLPKPQADALRGALGHTQHATDQFLIGVATLTLLTELAAEEPLLITVDDTDQLDEPTAACLAFVARRLDTSRVAMLLAAHSDPAAEGPGRACERSAWPRSVTPTRSGWSAPNVRRHPRRPCAVPSRPPAETRWHSGNCRPSRLARGRGFPSAPYCAAPSGAAPRCSPPVLGL